MGLKSGYKQTKVGVIPEEWEVRPLGTLTTMVASGRSRAGTAIGTYPVHGSTGVLGYTDKPEYEGDAILAARVGANAGKLNLASGRYGVTDNTIIVRLSDGFCLPFFWRQLEGRCLNSMVFGSGQPLITGTQLKALLLRVPPPSEQRAIAGALSDVDALIGGLDQIITKKRDLKQAAMQQLLTGQTRLPGFHGDWAVKRLGSVLKFQVGFPFSSAFFNEEGQGIRLVKNRDLKSDDQVFHYSGKYDPAFLVSDGDVLVGMDGDFLPCLWVKGPALLNQRVGRIVPLAGMDRVFAFYYLLEPLKEIEAATSSTTVKHLSHGDIEDIEKPLPSEAEQTAIAEVLSDLDAELAALEQRRDKTRALKQGMMQELLTGRTRLI